MITDYTYGDIELKIEYDFHEFVPGTYDSPSEGGYVEITDILHRRESILELVTCDLLAEIGEEIYEDLKNN
tara:strand:+ start:103 stop:315 length:213 start_codon:yes stop_codon:yes gene_type:complete